MRERERERLLTREREGKREKGKGEREREKRERERERKRNKDIVGFHKYLGLFYRNEYACVCTYPCCQRCKKGVYCVYCVCLYICIVDIVYRSLL